MRKRLITTGGTIDKVYVPTRGELTFDGTLLPEMLTQARVDLSRVVIENLMQKDSLDMTDEDRELIAESCVNSPEGTVVVTHGTDTMPETARHIKRYLLDREIGYRSVILTGAMVPFSVDSSDALFNLGTAFASAELVSSGVFIAMNGKLFEADMAVKDKELGAFKFRP